MIDDLDKFLALVGRSGLIEQARLNELVTSFHQDGLSLTGTVEELVSYLTSRGVLTTWQCRKLQEGKYKGFFLDQYKLLDRVSDDDKFNYYLAQDTNTGKRARLRIHQPGGIWPTKIEFDVLDEFD